jgi:PAS domain S-box-containing protein
MPDGRPTIGLLIDDSGDPIARDLWAGAENAATERDANLLCVVGGALRSPAAFAALANVVYDLVSADNVDGLVVWAGGLGRFVGPEELAAFCTRYRPLPLVAAGMGLEGIPTVSIDHQLGMRQVVTHLLQVHGCRRIAYLPGVLAPAEAEQWYRAYAEALAEHDLSPDPALVTPGGLDLDAEGGALGSLLDDRRLTPGADFDALVAHDSAIPGVLEVLEGRGICVPQDVAVVGFGNGRVALPLTMVPALAYEQGRRAAEMVLALIAGRRVPARVVLSPKLALGRTCGCADPARILSAEPGMTQAQTLEAILTARRAEIVSQMVEAAELPAAGGVADLDPAWPEHLLAALAVEAGNDAPGVFLSTLEKNLDRVAKAGGNLAAWQGVLSTLRRHVLPGLSNDRSALSHVENLLLQAWILAGEAAQQASAQRALRVRRQRELLGQMDQALMTLTGMPELADLLARELPRLEIPACHLSLYEDPTLPAGWSNLVLAYDGEGRSEPEPGSRRFPSHQLALGGALRRDGRTTAALYPLHFGEDQLGLILLESDSQQAELLASLPLQISSALHRVRLLGSVESHAIQLQTGAEISRAAGSILDLDQLLEQAVNLIRERFDLYYVGLFLVEETGERDGRPAPAEWAVLRAGTGDAGRAMMAAGHRLKVGSESMIGWSIANLQARIALDVGEEAVRFDNPYLPHTRSEMALPFVSRGRVIGAMTIQSDRPAAFTIDDVTALQTMADELANAVENARLFEERERRIIELSIVNEIGQAVSSALDLAELLEMVYQQVSRLFDTTNFYIATYQDGSSQWLSAFHLEESQRQPTAWHSIEAGLTGYILRSRKPLLFRSPEDAAAFHRQEGITQLGASAKSWLGVPLLTAAQVVGVMAVQSYERENLYNRQDLALFSTIAAQVATALDNLRLLETARQRADELGSLHELSLTLVQEQQDVETVLETIARRTTALLNNDGGGVWLWREQDRELELAVTFQVDAPDSTGRRLKPGEGLAGRAFEERRILVAEDDLAAMGGPSGPWDAPFASAMAAPLIWQAQVVGTLVVSRSWQGSPYSSGEEHLLGLLATQAAAIIQNARLFEEARAHAAEQATLRRISEAVSLSLETQELLDTVLETVCAAMSFDAALVSLYERESRRLSLAVQRGLPQPMVRKFERDGLQGTLCDFVFQTGETICIDDVREGAPVDVQGLIAHGLVTYAGTPLSYKGERLGTICFFSRSGRRISSRDLSLLESAGVQIGVGVANTRLFEEEQRATRQLGQRVQELDILNDIGRKIEENPPIPELLQWLPKRVPLAMQQPEGCVVAIEFGGQVYGEAEAVSLPCQIVQGLYAGGERAGRLYIAYRQDRQFLNMESALLGDISRRVSGYIENRRLLEEIHIHAEELAVLNELSHDLTVRLSVEEVLQETYRQAARLIDTTNFYIGLYEPERDQIRFALRVTQSEIDRQVSPVIAANQGLSGYIIQNRTSVLVEEDLPRRLEELGVGLVGEPALSWLGVPLMLGERVLGVMIAQSFTTPRAYSEHDRNLLIAIAGSTAIALQNAHLFELEQQAALQLSQRVRELDTLNDIGRKIDEMPPIPDFLQWLVQRIPAAMRYPELCQAAVQFGDQFYGLAEAPDLPCHIVQGLRVAGRQMGKLTIGYIEDRGFLDEESALLGDIARRVSGYLENRRLLLEAQQAARELVEERTLLRTLIDNLPDPIFVKDGEGRYLVSNAAHLRALGVATQEEVLGKTDSDFSLDLAVDTQADEQEIMRTGRPLLAREEPAVAPDGRSLWYSTTKVPLRDRQGKVTGLVGISRDITERKLAVLDLERRNVQLRTAAQVSRAASSVLSVEELIAQSVNWIHDRFGFYYVGLFLVDENGRQAVLRAGSGEAGRIMVEAGHSLEIGGSSMIGGCIAEKRARIALDVGQEAVRFANPYLPETRSEMALPLISRGEVQGALTVQSRQEAAFSEEDVAVLQVMADQLANAIANARLFDETQHRLQDLTVLAEASNAVSASLDLDTVVHATAQRITAAMSADGCIISVWDAEGDRLVTLLDTSPNADVPGTVYRLADYPASRQVLTARQPTAIRVRDPGADPAELELLRRYGNKSLLMVPMIVRDQAIALLEVVHTFEERAFAPTDIGLCQTLANQVAYALDNARLFEETQQRLRERTMLSTVSQALAGAPLQPREIAEIIVYQFLEVMGAPEGSVSLLDPEQGRLHTLVDLYVGEEGIRAEEEDLDFGLAEYPATARVLETLRPLVVQASDPEADPVELAYMEKYGVLTLVILPLAVKGQAIGIIELESPYEARRYTPQELDLAMTLANQAAIALENARLFEQAQVQAEEQAALRRITEAVNRSLELQELLDTAVEVVSSVMRFDAALVSLIDPETGRLVLAAERGLPEPMARKFGQQGLKGTLCEFVLQKGQAVSIDDIRDGAPVAVGGLLEHELFTYVGAPLFYKEDRIGTICCFNQAVRSMSARELKLLENMGAQIAVGVANARLLAETQAALAEVEASHRSYLRQAWQDHLRQQALLERSGLLYDRSLATRPEEAAVVPDLWSPEMERALEEGGFAVANGGDEGERSGLAMPITLRGETIGILGVEAQASDRRWTAEDRALMEAVGEQLAQALEGARLFADTQRRAERERLISEISAQIRASTDVRDILETAAVQLGQALGTSRASIRLGVDDVSQEAGPRERTLAQDLDEKVGREVGDET